MSTDEQKALRTCLPLALRRSDFGLLKFCLPRLLRHDRSWVHQQIPIILAKDCYYALGGWAYYTDTCVDGLWTFSSDQELAVFLTKVMWSIKSQDVYWLSVIETLRAQMPDNARAEGLRVRQSLRVKHGSREEEALVKQFKDLVRKRKLDHAEEMVEKIPSILNCRIKGDWVIRGAMQLIATRFRFPTNNEWVHDLGVRAKEWKKLRTEAKTYETPPWFAYGTDTKVFTRAVGMMAGYYHRAEPRFPSDAVKVARLLTFAEYAQTRWQLEIKDQSHLADDVSWYHCIWKYPALESVMPRTNGSWVTTLKMWKEWGRRNSGRAVEWARDRNAVEWGGRRNV